MAFGHSQPALNTGTNSSPRLSTAKAMRLNWSQRLRTFLKTKQVSHIPQIPLGTESQKSKTEKTSLKLKPNPNLSSCCENFVWSPLVFINASFSVCFGNYIFDSRHWCFLCLHFLTRPICLIHFLVSTRRLGAVNGSPNDFIFSWTC